MTLDVHLKLAQSATKQKSTTWLSITCVAFMLCVTGLVVRNKLDTDSRIFWVDHTYKVIKTLDKIRFDIFQSGSRVTAEEQLEHDLTDFHALTRDNPTQVRRLQLLQQQITLAKLSVTPNLSSIQQILDEMAGDEQRLLTLRRSTLDHSRRQSNIVFYTSLTVAFLIISLIVRKIGKDSEKRKQMEQQLLSSESKYRALIDNVSAVIYSTDIEGNIEYASAGVFALTGYTEQMLKGKRYTMLVAPPFLPMVRKHYEYQFRNNIHETTLEFCTQTPDGGIKWVEQIALLLKKDGRTTGFQCFVRDITDKKKIEQELEASESKLQQNRLLLQSILDNTSSIIYVKSLDGRYIIANKRFCEVLHVTPEQVIDHTDFDFTDTRRAAHYKEMDDNVLATGHAIEVEEEVITPSGHTHILLTKFPLRDNDNNILGIGGIATDITERVHYQQQLITAKTEAEDARRMQEQFLANMSHEIRTPMNGIQGMTNLLLETPLSAQQSEFAAIISRSVDNLLVIINDILDFSRIKAGKLAIEKIDFRPEDVIANAQSLFAHRIKKKNLFLKLDIDASVPEWVQGDPHRLNQVLINLVGNAIKFTEAGGITLSVKGEEQAPDMMNLFFEVTDTGIGIPDTSLPHIFDSFSQASEDISRKYGGTGLGLAICHQLLQLQGGDISVSSKLNHGTCFSFRLPVGCRKTIDVSRQVGRSSQDFTGILTNRRFLVVEDNPVNQKLVDFVLKKAGAVVTLADNGEQAIEMVKLQNFDIIIMDLQMPGMDGYATTRFMRGQLKLRTPIMAMTANALNGERIRCLEAGMNDYMSKPFDFRDFYAHVTALINETSETTIIKGSSEPSGDTYSLALLEEVGDDEYLQDILNTFLTSLPEQLAELKAASEAEDHDRLFFISHKMKGSCGMLQAKCLIEKLGLIQQRSKDKKDVKQLVQETELLFTDLLHNLGEENRRFTTLT